MDYSEKGIHIHLVASTSFLILMGAPLFGSLWRLLQKIVGKFTKLYSMTIFISMNAWPPLHQYPTVTSGKTPQAKYPKTHFSYVKSQLRNCIYIQKTHYLAITNQPNNYYMWAWLCNKHINGFYDKYKHRQNDSLSKAYFWILFLVKKVFGVWCFFFWLLQRWKSLSHIR